MTAIIETKHLNCQSGFRYLLEDINWTVQPGQRWVIFGQNGSGKTTLLSIIAGCKQATGGEVKLFGQPFTNSTILALRRQIGSAVPFLTAIITESQRWISCWQASPVLSASSRGSRQRISVLPSTCSAPSTLRTKSIAATIPYLKASGKACSLPAPCSAALSSCY